MSATEYILKNYLILRKNTSNLGELCAFFIQKGILQIDESDYIKNPYTNASSGDKNEKLYEFLSKKEISNDILKEAFEKCGNSHLLEITTWPTGTKGTSSEKKLFWNVPSGNRQFVGREEILEDISNSFKNERNNKSVITTCKGLGGIGKTSIAIEYAYTHWKKTNVFWFGAAANLESQMEDLFQKHGVNLEWFESNENWLMIFDNAEDPADIEEFIPNLSGHILITSRNIQWEDCALIEIDIFKPEESRRLCEKILQKKFEDFKEVDILGSELGHLPLALTIALYYMKRHLTPISDYLRKFKEKKREMLELEFNFKDHRLPAVYSTWMISFEKMVQENSYAAHFLVICAYYPDPDEIYWKFLKYFVFLQTSKFTLYDQVREILIKYSMIKVEEESFKIHRLVQQVLKLQFQKEEAENIYIFSRLSISSHINSTKGSERDADEYMEEMMEILKRCDSSRQHVIFALLIYLKEIQIQHSRASRSFKNFVIQNFNNQLPDFDWLVTENIQLPDAFTFQMILAHLGYLFICKRVGDFEFSDGIISSLLWIINSYKNLKQDKKPLYWDFFAIFNIVNESSTFKKDFFDKKTFKIWELIFEILHRDFEIEQVKFISQGYVNTLSGIYEIMDIHRFIEYSNIEIDIIQNLKGLEYDLNYIYRIYEKLGNAYGKIGDPKKAFQNYQLASEILQNSSLKEYEYTKLHLNRRIKKNSRKIQESTEKIKSLGKGDELIAKCYSEYGFKKEALKFWKNVIAKPDAKYQNFIEISLISHQISNDSESIHFLRKAQLLAIGENLILGRKINIILGFLTKISENWESCMEIQNILKADFEMANQTKCSEYQDVIENLALCHFVKGDKETAKNLISKHNICKHDEIFQGLQKQHDEIIYKKIKYFHLIDFPIIELISDDLKYRVCKLMEYSERLDWMSVAEIRYAEKILNNYEAHTTNLSRNELKFKLNLIFNIARAIEDQAGGSLKGRDFFDIQKYIGIVKEIWGEGGSYSYRLLQEKGDTRFLGKTMKLQFYLEALKSREAKYGESNLKCIPALLKLEEAFKQDQNFEQSLKCSRKILEIFQDSDLGQYEEFREEFKMEISAKIAQREHDLSKSTDCTCKACYAHTKNLAKEFEEKLHLLSDYDSEDELDGYDLK